MSEEIQGRRISIHRTHDNDGSALFISNIITTTKYNILTFLPKNLFEQFSRIANFYFLIIASTLYIFQKWAPLNGAAAIFPLILVLLISAFREGVEDFLRFLSDRDINNTDCKVLNNGNFITRPWSDILVGDVIMLNKNEQVPADMIILATSEPDNVAYIDTCNLDGETNLKVKQCHPFSISVKDSQTAQEFYANIECDMPNYLLYNFNGFVEINGQLSPLENKQILLRGCILRNTHWVIGVVVYTGLETKLMMNSSSSRSKVSSLEIRLNNKLLTVFLIMLKNGIIA